jgi:hypothetical protein
MTTEGLIALFRQYAETEFLKFKFIEKPAHPRADVCAFLMLHDALPGTGDMVSGAEHDEIYLDIQPEDLAPVATPEMVRDLVRCGVRYASEYGCFAMFV